MSECFDLLFELGTEELPPKSLLSLSRALKEGVEAGLTKAGLSFGRVVPYATPRRLAIIVEALETAQPDQDIERRGPALNVAYQPDGSPSKALEGFLRSCGAEQEQLFTLTTDKGEWLAFRQQVQGAKTKDLIPDIIRQALSLLPIAKRMRWGSGVAEFVRPVHWVVLLFGHDVIDADILGVKSGRETRGHRFHGASILALQQPHEYVEKLLHQGHVMADFEQRREKIRLAAETSAQRVGGKPHIELDLLDEVTSLVEWPVPVLGGFESRFLALPPEVLITTMQANQKYFPVKDLEGQLLPNFITFSNIDSSRLETVREGNERVVRPRLSDAEFFWKQDRSRTLESRVIDLAQVTFQNKLGSMHDKVLRVAQLAKSVAQDLGLDAPSAERAGLLAKADLLTNMVGEFPELQGIMGRYYARADGETVAVAAAIEEQYLPKVSGGPLPLTSLGYVVALAEKIDTLTGIFSAGLIPTGDKDPYALRRAALGVIRLNIEGGLDLNLADLLSRALNAFKHEFDRNRTLELLESFIFERLRGYCLERGYKHDEFEAVLSVKPISLLDFDRRLQAVQEFRALPEATSLAAANKRIRNLLRKAEDIDLGLVSLDNLIDPAEKVLNEAVRSNNDAIKPLLAAGDYKAALCQLAGLRSVVDIFFDSVMVMAEDLELRRNRLSLLAGTERLFLNIADISRLQELG